MQRMPTISKPYHIIPWLHELEGPEGDSQFTHRMALLQKNIKQQKLGPNSVELCYGIDVKLPFNQTHLSHDAPAICPECKLPFLEHSHDFKALDGGKGSFHRFES